MGIRIMCARLMFILIKLVPPKKLELFFPPATAEKLFNSTLHLIRTRIQSYRQLGVKISSLILHLPHEKRSTLEKEMFKIMAV